MLASISSTAPWNGQQSVGVSSNITVTFGSAMTASTISAETIKLRDASGNLVTNSLSYNTSTRVLTIDPSSNLVSNSSYYSVTVIGGAEGVKGSDNSTLAQTYQYYFTCGTPAFSEQAVFTGLTEPTNIEFSLNGRAFVAEKSGLIKTFDSIDDTSATITADLRTQVHNFWDRGLLGMAIDPNFDNGRPYLYVLYTRDADLGGNAPKFGSPGVTSDGGPNSTTDGANVSGRLSRLTIGANGVMTGSEQVIIDDWVNQFPSHSIGDLKFGPDGMLYASAGDGASFNAVDYGQLGINNFNDPPLEGGAVRSQDILTSGDPTGLDGTVIRINPDTGTGVAGSPYASSSDANNRRIVANGLRNPFRITFKPGTGELYIADTGWGAWEEINRIPNATDSIAENFGWPAYEGPVRQSGYDSANIPVLESFYANPSAHTTPWFAYSHSQQVIPGTAEPTGGSSPTGLAFYQGGSYPAAFDGALFFCDYSRGTTYVAFAGPDGQVNPNNRLMFALNRKPVELTVGPNGNIYMADMVNGAIRRYVATGYNNAPTAHIAADQTTGPVPLTVNFSGATSTDPDNDALIYEWDLDGDGQFDDSTSTTPSFTYTTIGDYSVKLRVTDAGGLSNIDTISINAGNTAPVPTMISPVSTLNWSVGQTINFSGSATDAQDGTLAGSSLSWSLVLLHGNEINNTTHEHPITSFTGESGSFQAPDHEYPSWIELRLTATDSNGLSSTISRRIDPQTVTLNFATNPSGLQIGLNSETLTAPFSKTVIVGSSNTITAVSPQTVGATTYLFTSWSDGGLGTHSYISPASPVTLSATFTAASLVKLSGTVIGTTGSNTTGNTRDKAFDGSLTTYFDAPTASGAWAGLDLGSAQTIQQIRYAPRADQAARMVGGKFQASNSADFSSGVIDLYTIESVPAVGSLTNASVASATGYRYVRYLSPANGYANVAEIEFYSAISASIPATPTYLVGWTTGTGN
ncbi:MAG TPA: PQQ-dependent sugar dehydrogenase, partial [Tepidisphaeraceae bacterium]|nr:PQQ-dependent sugar dehydrogenase [Tepidisphaeraceae bacterium]